MRGCEQRRIFRGYQALNERSGYDLKSAQADWNALVGLQPTFVLSLNFSSRQR